MPDPLLNDPLDSGIMPVDKEELDLSSIPITRRRVSPADRAMTRDQASAYQAGAMSAPGTVPMDDGGPNPDFSQPPLPLYEPGPPGTQPQPVQPQQPPQYQQPPVGPQDTEPVRRRINKLYGQWKGAEERAVSFEDRALRAEARLAELTQPQMPPMPQYQPPPPAPRPQNPYESAASPVEGQPPLADFVPRAELQNLLYAQTRFLMEQQQIRDAQLRARAEAETDFPDVFANPELRDQYDLVMQKDQFLQRDPQGPYKAAALARGLNPSQVPPGGYAPTAARKAQVAGLGATIPSGNQQSQLSERQARYNQAIQHARRTGDLADFARARRIQMGLPG